MNPEMSQMQTRYQDYQRELDTQHLLGRARRERQEARQQAKASNRNTQRTAHA